MAKDKLKKSHPVADDGEPANEHVKSDGKERKKAKKRQAELDPDLPTTTVEMNFDQGEVADGVLDFDVNEPTMGDKLASLTLQSENDKSRSVKEQESSGLTMPPSANSVDILLKQALHADDRALILDCLFTQDEKVIRKTISQLKTSQVHKFFNFLVSNVAESRGAIMACALPWLKFLPLQHASVITSQESSFQDLNSLNQLIGSRVSTFKSAIELSSAIDLLCAGDIDEADEGEKPVPVIYEDQDSDEESDDAMDTDQNNQGEEQSDDAFESDEDIKGDDDKDDVDDVTSE
ncbi:WD repeat-containing protein 43 [Neltuma alba]|uniref:WD repeat-containing protein 43 n=1 Tax=Neltuma alba TaxID=207710 RepID=UPI0010A3E12D|nr:WD repeat-containing protein 43 [Prosopis alba]